MNVDNSLAEHRERIEGIALGSLKAEAAWPAPVLRLTEAITSFPELTACGLVNFGLALVMVAFLGMDERTVAGANPWLKPIKYAIGMGLYLWTLSAVLWAVADFESLRKAISRSVAGLMLIQLIAVSIQAASGVESHYNITTGFDRWLFAILGVAGALNTVFASMSLALVLTSAREEVPAALIWGMRMGLLLFVAASFQGVQMILHQSHTVGAADGTAGLPFLNWSTTRGDLRTAHVFGLIALQVLPCLGWLLSRMRASAKVQTVAMLLAALAYGSFALWVNRVAMSGRPLF